MDFSIGFAPLLAEAVIAEREREAQSRRWLRRLRQVRRRERHARPRERTVIVDRPAHLAGVHKL